ncbi:hypothetical protein JK358_07845 [Nocardia sp. 2]|uniref:Uncharacterized protein n=1 Tax=Nocardia acididurans TaxID=2802282 RepID=A0ABS1M0W3_9NOCA|nr:hypothetical protein [Nocardia acididurans]MBL1074307.1 hypothetical protein [Nocardia acididurans]
MLREHDVPEGANIDLIEHIARFGLERGLVVIVEGILHAVHFSEMLERLGGVAQHALRYGFDVGWSLADAVERIHRDIRAVTGRTVDE